MGISSLYVVLVEGTNNPRVFAQSVSWGTRRGCDLGDLYPADDCDAFMFIPQTTAVRVPSRTPDGIQTSGWSEPKRPVLDAMSWRLDALCETHRNSGVSTAFPRVRVSSTLPIAGRYRAIVTQCRHQRVIAMRLPPLWWDHVSEVGRISESFPARRFGRPLSVVGGLTIRPPRSLCLRAIFHEPSTSGRPVRGGLSSAR